MAELPHRVRRLAWRARTPSRELAFALRPVLRQETDEAIRQVESACAAADAPGQVLRLARLEVSLCADSIEALRGELRHTLPGLLAEALRRSVREAGAAPAATDAAAAIPAAEYLRSALLAYLETGRLDWPLAGGDESPRATLAGAALALADEQAALAALFEAAPEACLARAHRLLALLPEDARGRLVDGLCGGGGGPDDAKPAQNAQRWLEQAGRQTPALRFRADALRLALRQCAEDSALPPLVAEALRGLCAETQTNLPPAWLPAAQETPHSLAAELGLRLAAIGQHQPALRRAALELREALLRTDPRLPLPAPLALALRGFFAEAEKPPQAGGRPASAQTAGERGTGAPPADGGQPPQAPRRRAEELLDALPQADAAPPVAGTSHGVFTEAEEPPAAWTASRHGAQALAASHAGLVLLHPYFATLFAALGLYAPPAAALDPGVLPRAAALLAWLASGGEDAIEGELALVKLLLGLDPGDPLPLWPGLLSEADRAEGGALLAAAIGHWSALGKTSPDGFRASFLERRGWIDAVERGWRLRVEGRPYDMLLGGLPWGIGIVKLPWARRAIFVEWPTP